jgi:hypothetical protein
MRKLIAIATLTIILASPATAAPTRNGDRTPRDRDNPIVRIYKAVVRLLTPSVQELPAPPVP